MNVVAAGDAADAVRRHTKRTVTDVTTDDTASASPLWGKKNVLRGDNQVSVSDEVMDDEEYQRDAVSGCYRLLEFFIFYAFIKIVIGT